MHLNLFRNLKKTTLDLWTFFKNSPKQLKTYIKTTLEARNFHHMSKRQKKKLVRKVKKAVRTRWLSLQASVYSVYQEYVGLTHTLQSIKDLRSGPVAKGLLKKNRFSRVSGNTIFFEVYDATSVLFKSNISVR